MSRAPILRVIWAAVFTHPLLVLGETLGKASSKLIIHIPQSLYKEEGYDHREALFGIPPFGASIAQNVYYADSDLCDSAVDTSKGYPAREIIDGKMGPWPAPYILMVDRGSCSFVKKVRNAQRTGAAAVIIADNTCQCSDEERMQTSPDIPCENTEPIMADDGSGADISIPSFLMFKKDADLVKKEVMDNHPVQIEMSWPIPQPDDRVEYDLWTTPVDQISKNFLKDFAPVAEALGDRAYFTPHMYIYDGVRAHCVSDEGENFCYSLCTNNGRYCATDPGNDLDTGITGADIVKESLRRICIWKLYGEADGIGEAWWNYINDFEENCNTAKDFMDEDCVRACYDRTSVDGDMVKRCMEDSGGLEGDSPNAFLDRAIASQNERGVVVLPTMFVNTAALRGSLSASTVFSAICGGYAPGYSPEICETCAGCNDLSACAVAGECVVEQPTYGEGGTIAMEESPKSTWNQTDEEYTNTIPIGGGSDSQLDMLLNLAGAFDGLDMCGVNLGQLAESAATAVVQSSTGQTPDVPDDSAFEIDELCSQSDESKFISAMEEFRSCSKWDIRVIIETLPSAIIGTAMRCAMLALTSDENDVSNEMMEGCAKALLGDNPLGNALKRVLLLPDINCPCFQSLADSVPECELDVWPIPLMGSWLKKSTCLFVGLGCGYFDAFCEGELAALNKCLPESGAESQSCLTTTECPEAEDSLLLSAPPSLLGIPLPDACVRVYTEQQSSTLAGTNIPNRYSKFVESCGTGKEFWEIKEEIADTIKEVPEPIENGIWLVELEENAVEPEEDAEELPEPERQEAFVQAMVEPPPSVGGSEPDSPKSSSGFVTGLVTGAVLTAAVASALVFYAHKKTRRRKTDSRLGSYAAIELT